MIRPLTITLLLCCAAFVAQAQPTSPHQQALHNVVDQFRSAIAAKDSTAFDQLFFHGKVAFIGIMSKASEASIQRENPGFQGVAVSNCSRFIREIANSTKAQEERMHGIAVDADGTVGTVSFDYEFLSDGQVTQWGREHWNLAFADGTWLITDVVYSIHLPTEERSPF